MGHGWLATGYESAALTVELRARGLNLAQNRARLPRELPEPGELEATAGDLSIRRVCERLGEPSRLKYSGRVAGFPILGRSLLFSTGYPPSPCSPQNLENKRFKF